MPRGRTVRTNRARDTFLATLAEQCNVSEACRSAGIGRATAYEWRDSDPTFAQEWKDAEESAADRLEKLAWERAEHDKSDRMLEILLKAHRPDKFTERQKVEHAGAVVLNVTSEDASL